METNNHFTILIVDDEKLNIELVAAYLKEEGYQLSFALNAKAALAMVIKKDINLILLDINMPKTDGFAVCEMLKADEKTKNIPVIFLTAQTDIDFISHAFEVGGVDYISKPFNGVELKARVKTHLQNLSYLLEIKHKQSKLAQLSITDHLTKVHNTLYFDSQIKAHLSSNKKCWIYYLRINNFERINQLYGYDKANKILRIFAKLLSDISPTKAIVSRLYGASFGVLLSDYDKKTIRDISNSLTNNFLKNKELKQSVNFSNIALKVNGDENISGIYKKLHNNIDNKDNEASLFIK
ncbi:MAG: response regulator [Campylobacterota bacterium]|nr:response regulator [Campylobacterota bacterium]